MKSFIDALTIGLDLCKVVQQIFDTTKEITKGTQQALQEMSEKAASIAREEQSVFREALRMAKASGEALLVRYETFKIELERLKAYTKKITGAKVISKEDFAVGRAMLQSIILHAKNCFENYPPYKEKLWKAIDLGTRLAERCKVEGQKASTEATNTRAVGYSAAVALGIVAVGFLLQATGGAGLGAAAFGLSAVGAGAHTRNRALEMDSAADKMRQLEGKLEQDVDDLNRHGDKIENHQAMTVQMVEELEIKMKLAMLEQKTAATN